MVMANIDTDQLLTTAEAAALIGNGMRPGTVQKHIVRKNIKGIKLGSDWLIHREEILKFIENRRPPGRPSN
jgi:excisionase family DNA binding protein